MKYVNTGHSDTVVEAPLVECKCTKVVFLSIFEFSLRRDIIENRNFHKLQLIELSHILFHPRTKYSLSLPHCFKLCSSTGVHAYDL